AGGQVLRANPPMPTLHALDLTELPGADPLWRPRPGFATQRTDSRPELPSDGFASPLGFWFAATESWATGVAPLCVEILAPEDLEGENLPGDGRSRGGVAARHSCRARLRMAAGRTRPA